MKKVLWISEVNRRGRWTQIYFNTILQIDGGNSASLHNGLMLLVLISNHDKKGEETNRDELNQNPLLNLVFNFVILLEFFFNITE